MEGGRATNLMMTEVCGTTSHMMMEVYGATSRMITELGVGASHMKACGANESKYFVNSIRYLTLW